MKCKSVIEAKSVEERVLLADIQGGRPHEDTGTCSQVSKRKENIYIGQEQGAENCELGITPFSCALFPQKIP